MKALKLMAFVATVGLLITSTAAVADEVIIIHRSASRFRPCRLTVQPTRWSRSASAARRRKPLQHRKHRQYRQQLLLPLLRLLLPPLQRLRQQSQQLLRPRPQIPNQGLKSNGQNRWMQSIKP